MIGSGIASALAGLTHVIAVSLGSAAFLGFLSISAKSIPIYIVCELISFAVAFTLTFIYGKKNKNLVDPVPVTSAADEAAVEQKTAQIINNEAALQDEIIAAPVTGQAESLTKVNDKVFSTKLMGNGAAIIPSSGEIFAPVSGKITVAYETKNAYGIKSDKGAEVLMHIGIDTVELKGKYFKSRVTQGQHVEKGQKLGSFDIEKLKQAGYDPTVMVVITNTPDYAGVDRIDVQQVKAGDRLISLTKR